MKRILFIFLLLFLCNTGYCQLKPLTKKELKALIKGDIAENNNYGWEICIDSTFSTNDTIAAYTKPTNDCSEFNRWYFKNANHIHQSTIKRKIYTTPSGWREYTFEGRPVSPNNVFKIKIVQKQDKLIVNRYNQSKLIDSYEVLGYTEIPYGNYKAHIISLVRQ